MRVNITLSLNSFWTFSVAWRIRSFAIITFKSKFNWRTFKNTDLSSLRFDLSFKSIQTFIITLNNAFNDHPTWPNWPTPIDFPNEILTFETWDSLWNFLRWILFRYQWLIGRGDECYWRVRWREKWKWGTVLIRTRVGTLKKRILTCVDSIEDCWDWTIDG